MAMHHIFYIPSSYAALIYALITGVSLLLCLYVGLAKHSREILTTSCGPDHYEFWPSISTTIGDMMPERQIWRCAFVLCVPFRLGASLALFSIMWQHGSGGVAELKSHWHHPRRLIRSSAFISVIMLMVDLLRMWAAMGWTIIASFESLSYHNLHFVPYILLCFLLQILLLKLVRRNMFNKHIYATHRDAIMSLRWKRALCWGETITAVGVIGFYLRHYMTCKNGSFSLSTMNEWTFATCNIAFDCTMWYELKQEGWWLSGSPQIFRALWESRFAQRQEHQASVTHGFPSSSSSPPSTAAANVNDHLVAETDGAALHQNTHCEPDLQESHSTYNPNTYNSNIIQSSENDDRRVGLTSSNNTNNNKQFSINASFSQSNGEPLLGRDAVVHRFTFCCPPFQLTLWMCYIYWWYMLQEMFINLIEHMYFMPMVAMSVSWEVSSILLMGAPCLLSIPIFRRIATGPCILAHSLLQPSKLPRGAQYRVVPMYVLFFFLASFSHMHMLVQKNSRKKILASSFGTFWLSLALFCRFLYPSPASPRGKEMVHVSNSRMSLYCLPLSLILCMLLRILYISQSPMFVEPTYSGIFGILLGVGFTTIIYREAMFAKPLFTVAVEQEQCREYKVEEQQNRFLSTYNNNINKDVELSNKKNDDDDNNNNNNNNTESSDNNYNIFMMKERNAFLRSSSDQINTTNNNNNRNMNYRSDKFMRGQVGQGNAAVCFNTASALEGNTNSANTSFHADHFNDVNNARVPQDEMQQPISFHSGVNNVNRQMITLAANEEDTHLPLPPTFSSTSVGITINDKDNAISGFNDFDEDDQWNSIALLANTYTPAPSWQLGLTLGLLGAAALTFLNCPNYIPRLMAIEPYPASFGVVAAFTCGLIFSPDILPIAPHLMRQKGKVGVIRRLVRKCFKRSWRTVAASMFVCTMLMLWATRQTNFTYEKRHSHYPVTFSSQKEHVNIKDWGVQKEFRGSKYVAFLGGLGVCFFLGVLCPIICELCIAHVYQRRVNRYSNDTINNKVNNKEPHFWASLELWWFSTFVCVCTCYTMCTVYPFVPFAWLIRERSRSIIFSHLMSLLCMTWHISHHTRGVVKLQLPNAHERTQVQLSTAHPSLESQASPLANMASTASATKTAAALSSSSSSLPIVGQEERQTVAASRNEVNNIASSILIHVRCRQQRLLHSFTIVSIVFCFVVVLVGREAFRVEDKSFPANKQTIITYSEEVMEVHDRLVKLYTLRNNVTDPNMKWFERNFYEAFRNDREWVLRHEVVEQKEKTNDNNDNNNNKNNKNNKNNNNNNNNVVEGNEVILAKIKRHSRQVREEIWEAANALTFFTGMIWTIHFAEDNYNVDSMSRILWHIQRTNAGVVGLLESDGMHVTNGNRDFAEYLSYYLGFKYTDYGPTALDNTFGCTLISRYPITKIHRYVAPSPLGELSCIIHAELDVYGLRVQTFVGHFGNTEHWADGLLQSQFLGQLALENPGPAIWLGYLVTYPGNRERYHEYSDPNERGKFRDPALELYIHRPWVRLWERGGYDEEITSSTTARPGDSVDFNVDYKVPLARHLEGNFVVNESFRRTPYDKEKRHFYFNATNRYTQEHPRFEFLDRYCQYCLFKRGVADEELPKYTTKLQPVRAELYDWWRVIGGGVEELSDTEIQIIQMRFYLNK